MQWYRKIVSSFSKIKGFDGWMIAKVELDILNSGISVSNILGAGEENVNFLQDDREADNVTMEIVKLRKSYAVICAKLTDENVCYKLDMHIMKPNKKTGSAGNGKKESEGKDKAISDNEIIDEQNDLYKFILKYDKSTILKFVNDVGDYNYIHRTDKPVVPGFLMFEDMLMRCAGHKVSIIFKNPVYADEKIFVQKDAGEKMMVFTAVSKDGILLFSLCTCLQDGCE